LFVSGDVALKFHPLSWAVMAAVTRLVAFLVVSSWSVLSAVRDETVEHRDVIGASTDEEVTSETRRDNYKMGNETELESLSRSRRALRQVRVFEIPETQRSIVANLGNDYTERFAFKAPAPRHLAINPVMGAILVRDGHKLDFETEPEFNFTVLITKIDNSKCE
jgi:hypothetical protein